MKAPREASVTAVIPTRKRPQMVVAAAASALAQTTGLVEVIVVVDGPDSETLQALAHLQQKERDGRLRVLALRESVGGAEARNVGVRHARAGWIAFLDDDDLWLPNKLALQLRMADEASAEEPVLASAVLARSSKGDKLWPRRLYRSGEQMAEYLFCRQGWTYGAALLQTSTLLAPRDLLLRVPFQAGLKKHQDWDWLLRVSAEPQVEVIQLAQPLTIFHVEGERPSVSRRPDWRFSQRWASERRPLFTPRAYSAFLATECAPQAARAGASPAERASLLWAMLRDGSPTLRQALLCAGFLLVPQALRRGIRDVFRGAAVPGLATQKTSAVHRA